MRMGNGYQLCSGANNTCRHRFGQCPIAEHRPMLGSARAHALGAAPIVDRTCRECGFIVHAPGCPTLPKPRPTFQEIRESVVKHCEKVRSEPPLGWAVHDRTNRGLWHFGPIVSKSEYEAFGYACKIGECSCYAAGGKEPGGYRNKATRAEAVAACWEQHEAEQAEKRRLDRGPSAAEVRGESLNTCPTCGFHEAEIRVWDCDAYPVSLLHAAYKATRLAKGGIAEQCKAAREKIRAEANAFVKPPGTPIVRAGWIHVGHDTLDSADKNVYDRYTREDSRASVWQDVMSGKWHAGPWTLTCFSTANWGFICNDAQSAMALIDREIRDRAPLLGYVAGKLTAEACALRFHARSKGEACPCGSFNGP